MQNLLVTGSTPDGMLVARYLQRGVPELSFNAGRGPLIVPEPALADELCVPYAVLLPYSTCQVVASPLGFTVPATVAEVGETAVTGPVITTGAEAAAPAARTRDMLPVTTATTSPVPRLPLPSLRAIIVTSRYRALVKSLLRRRKGFAGARPSHATGRWSGVRVGQAPQSDA